MLDAQVLEMYAAVLTSLSEPERAKLQRSMGLKIEQLKVHPAHAG